MSPTHSNTAPPLSASPTGEEMYIRDHADELKSPSPPANISSGERLISLFTGTVLTTVGLLRGKASGLTLAGLGAALLHRGYTRHCYLYDALGLDTAEHNPATAVPAQQGEHVQYSISVNRPVEELYPYWRKLENLPSVMRHLESDSQSSHTRSHWIAKGPFEKTLEWDAEIINERENEFIAWRSLPGSEVETAGSVRFTPLSHQRGTAIHVSMKYNPPGGKFTATIASWLGKGLEQDLRSDLRRFKSHIEAGEYPTTDGQPRGPRR